MLQLLAGIKAKMSAQIVAAAMCLQQYEGNQHFS
jgi:hypothetical protein